MAEEAAPPVEPTTAENPAEPVADGNAPAEGRRRRRWPWITALVVSFLLFTAAGAFAGATVSYAGSLAGRLLPGTTIAGVDVGGKTTDEALVAVRRTLAGELNRTIVLRWGDRRWTAPARKLGARTNARRIIAEVAQSQSGMTWQDWARLRWLGDRPDVEAEVAVAYRRPFVERFIARAAREINTEPVDSTLEVAGDGVAISASSVGHKLRPKPAAYQVMAMLRGTRPHAAVRLDVEKVKPEVVENDFAEVLLLDQSEHRLTLFRDGTRTHSWIVATGTGDYPTPLGRYHVTEKRYMPTWVNPAPDGWGKDMPESIPPGKSNPLGLRALNWDAPAIRFHGTQAIDTLGTDASHGCVRMSNDDVIQLYDLVEVGAVIISQT